MGLRTGGRRAKGLKNRVISSKIELRFREVRSQSRTSRKPVLQEIIGCIFKAVLSQKEYHSSMGCGRSNTCRSFLSLPAGLTQIMSFAFEGLKRTSVCVIINNQKIQERTNFQENLCAFFAKTPKAVDIVKFCAIIYYIV